MKVSIQFIFVCINNWSGLSVYQKPLWLMKKLNILLLWYIYEYFVLCFARFVCFWEKKVILRGVITLSLLISSSVFSMCVFLKASRQVHSGIKKMGRGAFFLSTPSHCYSLLKAFKWKGIICTVVALGFLLLNSIYSIRVFCTPLREPFI